MQDHNSNPDDRDRGVTPGGPTPAEPPPRAAGTDRAGDPVFPQARLRVVPLADPVLDRLGHDPRSGYVERYWLAVIGPSSLLLLRRLAAELERTPDGITIDTVVWARELGVGMRGGRNGPFWRAVERCCRFGAARRNGELLAVRRRLPPLTARQVERLPDGLKAAHEQWATARLARQKRPSVVRWSPLRDEPPAGQQDRAVTADPSDAHPYDDAA